MRKVSLSVVAPVYNEEEIVVSSTRTTLKTLLNSNVDFEIVLINDGSTDNTRSLIDDNFRGNQQVVICHQSQNTGMGGAVRKGIGVAHKEYIICVPTDSPLDDETFSRFLQHIGNADVLVSFRKQRLGYNHRMLINSWFFHSLVSVLFNMRLKDYNWIHLYHRKIFDSGVVSIESNGLFMLAETLIKAKRAGFTFCEFEVNQKQRLTGIATASKLSSVLKTLWEMLRFRIKY